MRLKFLFVLFLALFIFPTVFSWTDNGQLSQSVDGCGTLSTENATYTLSGDVSTSGTCFTISANNITLNCNGNNITYGSTSSRYAIYSSGYDYLSVDSCMINQVSTSGSSKYGIYIQNSDNSSFTNNVFNLISSYSYGFYLTSAYNPYIYNNTIDTNQYKSYGIYLSSAISPKIIDNKINTTNTRAYGIYLSSSRFANLSNNAVDTLAAAPYFFSTGTGDYLNHTISSDNLANGKPVYFQFGENNITIDNGNFSNYGEILFFGMENLTIKNTDFKNNSLFIYGAPHLSFLNNYNLGGTIQYTDALNVYYSPNSIFDNNQVSTFATYSNGMYIQSSAYSNITNNNISTFDTSSNGLYLSSSYNSNLSNNYVRTFSSNSHGIYDTNSYYVDVFSNDIKTFDYGSRGFYFSSASYSVVSNNTIETLGYNSEGMYLTSTRRSEFYSNNVTANDSMPYYISSTTYLDYLNQTLGEDNLANGKKVYYLFDKDNLTIENENFSNYGQLLFFDINNFTIKNSDLGGNSIQVFYAPGTKILNNANLGGNYYYARAIYFYNSENSTAYNNTINISGRNSFGVYAQTSKNSNLSKNIIYSENSSSYGMYVSSSENSTIFDNYVNSFDSNGAGIYFSSSDLTNVTNNWVITNGSSNSGISFSSSSNSTLHGNNVTTYGNNAYGFYASSNSYYLNMSNNFVRTEGTYADAFYLYRDYYLNFTGNIAKTTNTGARGIYLRYGDNSIYYNNSFITTGSGAYGIYTTSSSPNSEYFNNTLDISLSYGFYFTSATNSSIHNNLINSQSYGIYLSSSPDSRVFDNVLPTSQGIYLNSDNNVSVEGNEINSTYYGLYCNYADDVRISNNLIRTISNYQTLRTYRCHNFSSFNDTIEQMGSSEGVIFDYVAYPTEFNISHMKVSTISGYPIRMNSVNSNLTISDSILSSLTNVEEVYSGTTVTDSTFKIINTTNLAGDEIRFSGNTPKRIENSWWLDVYANYTESTPASGINISILNSTLDQVYSGQTDSNGKIEKQSLLEYSLQGGVKTYSGNYTVNALLDEGLNYSESKEVNLTGNKFVYFTSDNTPPVESSVSPANGTYLDNGTNVNISAEITDSGRGVKNATVDVYDGNGDLYNSTTTNYSEGTDDTVLNVILDFFEGVFKWRYKLFDWNGNLRVSDNYTMIVDETFPLIDFADSNPINNSVFANSFVVNVSIFDINLANVTLDFGGNLTTFNKSNDELIDLGNGSWLFTYNQNNLIEGEHYLYYVSTSDLAGNINLTEVREVIGNTRSRVTSITTNPDENNFIDPYSELNVTANIFDIDSNFDYSVLQWSEDNSTWNNVSMQNVSVKGENTQVFSSFNLPGVETNITLRIISFDDLGGVNYSQEKVIESKWDCTWNVTPSSFEEVLGFYEDKFIGNLTVYNTGDSNYSDTCNINFKLNFEGFNSEYWNSASWYSTNRGIQITSNVKLAANTSAVVPVYASFPSTGTPFIQSPSISVSSNVTDTETSENITYIATTLIISPPNPLLYQDFVTYPSNFIYLTPGGFNLTSYVRNLGADGTEQNVAHNVTFNWTLPDSLNSRITSGDITKLYENLSTNLKQFNTLMINFTGSNIKTMDKGKMNVTIYSYGYDNDSSLIINSGNSTLLNKTIELNFVCYDEEDGYCVESCGQGVDPDCEIPPVVITTPGSGSGGGSGGGGAAPNLFDKSEATFELVNGEQKSFTLTVGNEYNSIKSDLEVTVTGENSEYVKVSPDFIKKIKPHSEKNLTVKITAPSYFDKGTYLLKFRFRGYLLSEDGTKKGSYSEEKYVTLNILERSREQADDYMKEAEELLTDLKKSNFTSKSAKKYVEEMNESYNDTDFLAVEVTFNNLKQYYTSAVEGKELLGDLNSKVQWAEKYGMDVVETKKLYLLAETIYNRGDYVLARKKLDEALSMYSYETKGEIKLWYLIKNNPWQSAGIFSGAIILFLIIYYTSKRAYFKRKISSLSKEESLLLGLMKGIQNKCFNEGKMSMTEYYNSLDEYQRQLAVSVKKRIKYESRLKNFFKLSGKTKTLHQERNRFIELIKELQTKYMAKGELDSRIYDNLIKSYSKHLGDVEEELSYIEIKKFLKKDKFGRRK